MTENNIYGDTVQGYSMPSRDPEQVTGDNYNKHILVCTSRTQDGCLQKGGFDIKKRFYNLANKQSLDNLKISSVQSMGYCNRGPVAVVYPDNVWYERLSAKDASYIINDHIINQTPVNHLTFDPKRPDNFKHLIVCTFLSACGPAGGGKVLKRLNQRAKNEGNIQVTQSYGCLKECSMGPICCDYPKGDWYVNVNEQTADDVWDAIRDETESPYIAGKVADK